MRGRWSALASVLVGCAGTPDQGSPRGVAEALVAAMDRADADRALQLYAPEDRLVYRKGARDDEESDRWDLVRFNGDEPWFYVPR